MDDTGSKFTLNDNDFKRGICTIEEKLEDECNFYHRWDALYGSRQNVNPISVIQPLTLSQRILGESIVDSELPRDDTPAIEQPEIEEIEMFMTRNSPVVTSLSSPPSVLQSELTSTTSSTSNKQKVSVMDLKKREPIQLSNQIKEFCRIEIESTASNERKNSKSLTTAYSDAKEREFTLLARKFDHERDAYSEELSLKKRRIDMESDELQMKKETLSIELELKKVTQSNEVEMKKLEVANDLKKTLITALVQQNKSADEIKEYLDKLTVNI